MKHEDLFWGVEDAEELSHSDPDEAIEAYLDQCDDGDIPDKIKVVEYRRRIITTKTSLIADLALERVWEYLEDEYGSFEYENLPSKKITDAAMVFADTVLGNYVPWQCEQTGEFKEVSSLDWIKENTPHWLDDIKRC